ncbi:MAG: disulfide bond formation protein DsbA [Gammaproteobacteria bacterium TMED95]|jgi:2-hydroxychromene-2-carboxylate isomerase|nr:disulfide bond formation protein DsbA [Gammaproteobacteria bacterium]OUV19116.1 MAG: disulfide bond formation protein DsbA [Gammaproteobacteria bacterium TMED95]
MKLEFHFDFGSPNAYLCHLLVPEVEARLNQSIDYVPVLLGGVFKATNNVSPGVAMQGILNKPAYAAKETERFLLAHGITRYESNPHFPVNTLMLMRGAIYAQQAGFFEHYVSEIYDHMWCQPKKMDDAAIFEAALTASDLPADAILSGIQDAEVKATLISNTESSVARGNFGSPTFFADDEMFFGKDKLRDFEEFVQSKR